VNSELLTQQQKQRIVDPTTKAVLATNNIPYGSHLFVKNGDTLKKGDVICEWDPYNAVIICEADGKIGYEHLEEGVTFREESDEQTGYKEKVVIDSRDKTKNPVIKILNDKKEVVKGE